MNVFLPTLAIFGAVMALLALLQALDRRRAGPTRLRGCSGHCGGTCGKQDGGSGS